MKQFAKHTFKKQKKSSDNFSFYSRKEFRLGISVIKGPLFILMFLGTALFSSGQPGIKGRITDTQKGLQFANVLLLRADSTLVKEVISDNNGEFAFDNVRPGSYMISSSMVGYAKFLSKRIPVDERSIVLPDIILEKIATELNEVIVKAQKPLYEQQIDKLVVNVQSSVTSSGNTVLEVLQKSPGVVVNKQDNSITMNGRSGVRVMINGKLMQLPLDVVIQMLDGMNAGNVEKIELITTPPAKYDAEGNAGIIHIVMKGNADFGTNGSFGLTYGYRWAENIGGNFNINHRDKNFAYFLDYSILRNHNLHLSEMYRQSKDNGFEQTVTDNSHRENVTTQQNLNAGIEWKLSNKTLLILGLTGYRRNWDMNADNDDVNHVTKDSTIITNMKIYESNIWQSATAGLGLQTKINAKSEISFSVDYLYYHNDNPSNYDNKVFYEEHNQNDVSKIDLKKNTPIRFLVAKADYQYNWSPSFTLEAGIKAVTSDLDNNVLVQQLINNVWTTDTFFTSSSTLHEKSGAAYVSTKWQAGNQWQINGGLRYEYTHTGISTPQEKNLVNRKYGYLFPSVFIKKDFAKNKDFQISYSRRITRPTYDDIAPFVFFWGPNTFSSGNTSLYPSISDAIKAGYHVKQWIVSLQFSHSKNEIAFLQPEKDNNSDNVIYRSQNLKYLSTLALTSAYSFSVVNWWKVQSNMTAQYQAGQTSHLQTNKKFDLYGLNVNVVNSFKLPADISIEISGMYQSKLLKGISEYLPVSSLNAGIQKRFGEKGTLKIAIDDIFNTNYWKIRTNVPENNLNTSFVYNFHSRYIRLTYTKSFGNNKLRTVKLKSGSEEERERIRN